MGVWVWTNGAQACHNSCSITFPTWGEEEQAGEEAWDKWDEVFRWLEAHGIYNEQIVYDEVTEQATIQREWPS